MGKFNWDYEKVGLPKQMGLAFLIGLVSLIFAVILYEFTLSIVSKETALYFFVLYFWLDLLSMVWNKYSPWAPSEDNEDE